MKHGYIAIDENVVTKTSQEPNPVFPEINSSVFVKSGFTATLQNVTTVNSEN